MSWFLLWGEDRGEARGQVECKGHAQHFAFAPNGCFCSSSSEVAVGFLFFFFFFFVIMYFLYRICPNFTCTQLFLVPYSFFVFYCLSRCLSRWKRCRKGSQMPAFLNTAQNSRQAKPHRSQKPRKCVDVVQPEWPLGAEN